MLAHLVQPPMAVTPPPRVVHAATIQKSTRVFDGVEHAEKAYRRITQVTGTTGSPAVCYVTLKTWGINS